jgi:hypothetical protein
MTPSQRVDIVKRSAKQLASESWTDIDLTLRQFGFPTSPAWDGNDRYSYCVQHLEQGGDAAIGSLGDYLFGTPPESDPGAQFELPWDTNRLRLFLSHVSSEKRLVSEMKKHLSGLGVDAFVAHEDIEPTTEWQDQIELALSTCTAMATILTPGFHESKWTDHEVGFCVARRILVVPVRLGVDPYGLISRYQAYSPRTKEPLAVANGIFGLLCDHVLTSTSMARSLVSQFADSGSFADARANVKLLERIKSWDPDMLREIEAAVEKNGQIRDAFGVPETVQSLIHRHRT